MKRWLPFLIAVLGALAACTHMPVTSMVRLARVDFTNTDPGELRAAVKLPRAVQPRPNGVSLRIGVRLASGHEEVQDFLLREVSDPSDVLTLNRELDRNTHIFAYRVDPAEVARLVAFRDALKRKQDASGGRGGTITIAIRPDACRSADLAQRSVYVTTYLRTPETGSYVPLTRDVDLRTIAAGRDLAAELPLCG